MGLILSRASGVCLPVAGFRARCQQSGSTDAQNQPNPDRPCLHL